MLATSDDASVIRVQSLCDFARRGAAEEHVRDRDVFSVQPGRRKSLAVARRSTTENSTFRHVAPAHLVGEGKLGTAVLIYGNLPPAGLRLRPWFADRGLARLVEESLAEKR
jgi:hypothetical protein